MISVITPTHDPRFLAATAESLAAQTYQGEWEWVIVPNGPARGQCELFGGALNLRPITWRVIHYPEGAPQTIGGIKRFACEQARGDIIVELDHDDVLAPDALETVAAVMAADRELSFVYSNFAEFRDGTWDPHRYDARYGWLYRDAEVCGHKVAEAIAFEPSAASIASIYFAPNHLRAWRAADYWRIGGHNAEMLVADDHDLVCRFYLAGQLAHIDRCLYLYRMHGNNSYCTLQTNVRKAAEDVRDLYIHRLVRRWADLNNLPMLDLCSGPQPPEGYEGVDMRHENADLDHHVTRWDLDQAPWPWPDNSFGVMRAVDALEHLRNPIQTMQEIYRVLAPGGWLLSMTPSTDGRGAFQDPTHVSFWNQNSFAYWIKANFQRFLPPVKARFQAVRLVTWFPSEWHKDQNINYVTADLVALKDGYRAPGLVEI